MVTLSAYIFWCIATVVLATCAPAWMAVAAGLVAALIVFRHELWLPRVPQFKG